MAELHVQRKRTSFLWLWIFLVIIAIAAGVYLYMHSKDPRDYPVPGKSTGLMIMPNSSAKKLNLG